MSRSLLWPSKYFLLLHYPATLDINTLSLHDALPISLERLADRGSVVKLLGPLRRLRSEAGFGLIELAMAMVMLNVGITIAMARDRKSTRLNSSHQIISYAVFCLKNKKKILII